MVEIRDSTVGTGGGDIVGQDKVLGAKVYIDKLIVGVPPSPYELAKAGRVEMAPKPPEDFVERRAEFGALKKLLLDRKGDAVAITAALQGAGGYGKTTLANALAHDADIHDAYLDGVLWVTLGEKPESLLLIISDLITRLTGTQPDLNTINAASAFGEALGDRRTCWWWMTFGANKTSRGSCRVAQIPLGSLRRATTALCLPMPSAKAWTPCATARRLS
jgi:hypothetical protein